MSRFVFSTLGENGDFNRRRKTVLFQNRLEHAVCSGVLTPHNYKKAYLIICKTRDMEKYSITENTRKVRSTGIREVTKSRLP